MKEWLKFIELKPNKKTKVFSVWSICGDFELGKIKWHPSWRHYCFFQGPYTDCVYSDRCLEEMALFVGKLNIEQDKLRKEAKQIIDESKELW